jgi:hypothetical protein
MGSCVEQTLAPDADGGTTLSPIINITYIGSAPPACAGVSLRTVGLWWNVLNTVSTYLKGPIGDCDVARTTVDPGFHPSKTTGVRQQNKLSAESDQGTVRSAQPNTCE